jgi:hypothetical protein
VLSIKVFCDVDIIEVITAALKRTSQAQSSIGIIYVYKYMYIIYIYIYIHTCTYIDNYNHGEGLRNLASQILDIDMYLKIF